MRAKVPSVNYAVLRAARDELERAHTALREAAHVKAPYIPDADAVDDAYWLGACAQAAYDAERSIFEFTNSMANFADAPGAADALRG